MKLHYQTDLCSKLVLERIGSQVLPQLWHLSRLEDLDLSSNELGGPIPEQLWKCSKLRNLVLAINTFNGSISPLVRNLGLQGSLDLSHNRLGGNIPPQIADLTSVDFSYNQLEGPIPDGEVFPLSAPTAFRIGKNMRGPLRGLQPCNAQLSESTVRKKSHKFARIARLNSRNVFSVLNHDGKVVYEDIVQATEGFDDKYCIWEGGSGRVCRALLPTGHALAVKKIRSLEGNEIEQITENFINEIRLLTAIQHRNIVKFYRFCSSGPHKFLVYDLIERGSLASIHPATWLDWRRLAEIVRDIAHALSFLSDLGISRILKPGLSNWTAMAGTYSYVAPELAHSMSLTEKCEVYRFGVLALKVIIGKHPGELGLSLNSLQSEQSMELEDLLDVRLPPPADRITMNEVKAIAKQARSCIDVDLNSRPIMREVLRALLEN
ncbi:hypothetical protein EUGRSUZ_E03933 [Eucalyptus grandis]|uniref:Uncharacterized protein n=2 Tax=Eucalyptus grandis TaxID=71139 RepID=A0ACC3L106_EUCGR|nr:hypothetical protein EUGRSUZ_E03933 [Eucalyptus grandis]